MLRTAKTSQAASDKGVVLMEFIIALPVIILFLSAAVDFCTVLLHANKISNVAYQTAKLTSKKTKIDLQQLAAGEIFFSDLLTQNEILMMCENVGKKLMSENNLNPHEWDIKCKVDVVSTPSVTQEIVSSSIKRKEDFNYFHFDISGFFKKLKPSAYYAFTWEPEGIHP